MPEHQFTAQELKKKPIEVVADKGVAPSKDVKDELKACPQCGQDVDHGYLSRSVPVSFFSVRVLYSSACGFLKLILFS